MEDEQLTSVALSLDCLNRKLESEKEPFQPLSELALRSVEHQIFELFFPVLRHRFHVSLP